MLFVWHTLLNDCRELKIATNIAIIVVYLRYLVVIIFIVDELNCNLVMTKINISVPLISMVLLIFP